MSWVCRPSSDRRLRLKRRDVKKLAAMNHVGKNRDVRRDGPRNRAARNLGPNDRGEKKHAASSHAAKLLPGEAIGRLVSRAKDEKSDRRVSKARGGVIGHHVSKVRVARSGHRASRAKDANSAKSDRGHRATSSEMMVVGVAAAEEVADVGRAIVMRKFKMRTNKNRSHR